jgi:1L-myo-inositol 1-phosphate cytidylyltransferase / CDP-L-myo-inositol myo-inositolphosphotransferase
VPAPIYWEASLRPKQSRTAIPAAPNLILLPPVASLDASDVRMNDGEPSVLGLSLMVRTVLAARAAGYGQIFVFARDHGEPPGTSAITDWSRLADALQLCQTAPLIITRATILAETDWLKSLATTRIEPAAWAAIADRIVVLAATVVPDALVVLQAEGGAYDVTAVQNRLTRRFGSAAAVPSAIDPMVVATSEDIRLAERRLLRGLVKQTDGFMARHFDRRISLEISRRLALTAVTPNQITMVSIAIGLCGAPFFLSALWSWQTIGALLFLLHSIVDGCDGELARLKFQESRYGGILDFWGDNVVHVATFGCMAVGWALSAAAIWPLLLGAAASLGILGSAGFVHWQQFRVKDHSGPLFISVSSAFNDHLGGMLDAASRRDFIYVLPVFALFGKSSWVLMFAAVGAPIFFLLLVFLAVRPAPKPTD